MRSVSVWEAATKKGKATLNLADLAPPEFVALSANGQLIAVANPLLFEVALFDLSGKRLWKVTLPPNQFPLLDMSMSFSGDDKYLICLFTQAPCRLRVADGVVEPIKFDKVTPGPMAYCQLRDLIAAKCLGNAGDPLSLHIRDLKRTTPDKSITLVGDLHMNGFSDDGKTAFVLYNNLVLLDEKKRNSVELWDATSWKPTGLIQQIPGQRGWGRIRLAPQGNMLAGMILRAAPPAFVQVWDLPSKNSRQLEYPGVMDFVFSPDGTTIILFMANGSAKFVDPATGKDKVTGQQPSPMPEKTIPQGPTLAWKEFTSAEEKFSVLFPGSPVKDKESGWNTYVVLAGSTSYMVAVMHCDQNVDALMLDTNFGKAGRHPTARITSKKPVKLGNNIGLEAVEEWTADRAMVSETHAYGVGRLLYQANVVCPKDKLDKAGTAKFFDSFKIEEVAKSK
ncbi:hypothetical protein AYO40_06525 [Planctomycetaceae bacterium SCGC AG-212-D15]|nr:hypothetical protein AYO40_06525 [Planctomycetaceae bacterium SCGC AG-212-D15]